MDNKTNLTLSETEVMILKWALRSKKSEITSHVEMAKRQNIRTDEAQYASWVETIDGILDKIKGAEDGIRK